MTTHGAPHTESPNGAAHFERLLSNRNVLRMHRTLGPHVHRRRALLERIDWAAVVLLALVALVIWLGWRPG